MKLLLDLGIKRAASENIAEDDQLTITVDTATEAMVRYLNSLFDESLFLNYQPQELLRPSEPAGGNKRRHNAQHVDACNTRRSESQNSPQDQSNLGPAVCMDTLSDNSQSGINRRHTRASTNSECC